MSYYDDFKIYWYNISTQFNLHGIESVYIYTKNIKQIMLIISPGNLYTFERKRNLVYILPRLDYEFQVYHSIAVKEFYKLILLNPEHARILQWESYGTSLAGSRPSRMKIHPMKNLPVYITQTFFKDWSKVT